MRKRLFDTVAARLGECLAELVTDALKTKPRVTCNVCGCTSDRPCVLRLDDSGSRGQCADMRPFGLEMCSACLTPEKRIEEFWT